MLPANIHRDVCGHVSYTLEIKWAKNTILDTYLLSWVKCIYQIPMCIKHIPRKCKDVKENKDLQPLEIKLDFNITFFSHPLLINKR